MGETGANELKFFNLSGDSREHQCVQRVELTIDGCAHLSVHSKSHFTVLMASNNGSVFAWMARPYKLIQPLAPDFYEIERNIAYVEREDEFEEEVLDEAERARLAQLESKKHKEGLCRLDQRQQRLEQSVLDLDNRSPDCITTANVAQQLANQRPELRSLGPVFGEKKAPKGASKE